MATKRKTTSRIAKASAKAKPSRRRTHKYECPNAGPQMTLNVIVRKIIREPVFARFMRDLLCRANQEDEAAIKCLESYFKPTDGELNTLCIPKVRRQMLRFCTEQGLLITVVANVYGSRR